MPFDSVEQAIERHPGLAEYSDKAQRGWLSAINSCFEAHPGDEGRCFATAWSVANKVDGKKPKSAAVAGELLRIAKLLLAFPSRYSTYRDGGAAFWSSKDWPKVAVRPVGDDFEAIHFGSKRAAQKAIADELAQYARRGDVEGAQAYLNELAPEMRWRESEVVSALDDPRRATKWVPTWIAFALSPVVRGSESASSLPESVRQVADVRTERMSKPDLFNYLVVKNKVHLPLFEELFGKVDISDTDTGGRLREFDHGKWHVIVDDKAKMDEGVLKELLDDAEAKLKSKGQGRLAYGDLMVIPSLGGRRVADYMDSGDFIRIGAKGVGRGGMEKLRYFLHELGHRNKDRYLSKEQRRAIHTKHFLASGRTPTVREIGVEEGDVLTEKNSGRVFKVKNVIYDHAVAEMVSAPDKRSQKNVGATYKVPSKSLATGAFDVEGKRIKETDFGSFFPTAYSVKNADEMYAELFAMWLLGKLSGPAKEWMDELH